MKQTTENKEVWFFHPTATPPTLTGLTRPYNFGVHLKNYGYDIKVFSSSHLHYSNENVIENNELFKINHETEIPHIFVRSVSSSGNGIGRILNMLSYYKNLLKTAKKMAKQSGKPDLIIASSPHPLALIAGIRLAKKFDVPIINEVRDFWPEVFFKAGRIREKGLIGRALLKGEHWIYKNSDALIFLKEGDYTYLTDKKWDLAQGGAIDLKYCRYINNGVDIEEFNKHKQTEVYQDPDLKKENFNVIYTGAIRPVNNVGLMIDAAKLLQDDEEIQFLIYGGGNELEELEHRIKEENIKNIKLKGYVNQKYMPSLLSQSSVNVLNYSQSLYNWSRGNSSNKLFEYMASGKPMISTVKMGYSPIEKYECGIELEENTAVALAKAIVQIKKLDQSTYDKLSQNALKAAKNYDYKYLAQELDHLMEEII